MCDNKCGGGCPNYEADNSPNVTTFTQMRNKENVLAWADAKGLLKRENALKQFAKTVSEVGELGDAIIKNQPIKIMDGIGDSVVCLIILASQLGLDIEECLQLAYDEIKGRTGQTINGTFVKD